jgi:hypothetical protein
VRFVAFKRTRSRAVEENDAEKDGAADSKAVYRRVQRAIEADCQA